MKRNTLVLTIFGVLCLLLYTAHASATPMKLRLDFFDEHFFGERNTIQLKKLIKDRYPNQDLRHVALERVKIIAKSRYGRGQVLLRVNGYETNTHGIAGTPDDFDRHWPYTFDYAIFYNPAPTSIGDWQLELQSHPLGNDFIVRRVYAYIDIPEPFPCSQDDRMIEGVCVRGVPMYEFYSFSGGDHYYSPNPQQPGGDYQPQGSKWSYPNATYRLEGLVPFYRLYNGSVRDHFYTADIFEADRAVKRLGYQHEATYQIFKDKMPGSRPLYRFYHQASGDHMYKLDKNPPTGYRFEKIAGYVFPQ